ncbi:MAG: glycosyltransferase [Euryarchaeota archaeon]|nr:glycosyltransferase [Euryarchaeota archaeon]
MAVYRQELFKVTEHFVTAQATGLARYRPIFIGERRFGEAPPGVEHRVPAPLRGFARIAYNWWARPAAFLPLFADPRPALVHAHFGVDGAYALRIAKKLDLPLVTHFHGYDATVKRSALLRSGNPKWIRYARDWKRLARGGTLFIAVAEFLRQRLLERGFPEDRTVALHLGLDLRGLEATPVPEDPTILHVARLTEKKGTMDLLEAFRGVVASRPRARLTIVGDGPLRAQVEAFVREKGLADHVRLLGTLDRRADVLDQMRRARIVCLPSVTAQNGDTEGLPMVLVEAAALGRPIVATRHAGIPELVRGGQTGWLVQEHDTVALREALLSLVDNRARCTSMGREARQVVEERFELGRQVDRLEELYDRVRTS